MQENIQAALSLCQSLSSVFFGCQHCCCSYKKLTFARSVSNFAGKFTTIPRWDVPQISKFPVGFLSSVPVRCQSCMSYLFACRCCNRPQNLKVTSMNNPGKTLKESKKKQLGTCTKLRKTELNSSKNRASLKKNP